MGPERFREFFDFGADEVIADDAGEFPEPECGDLSEHLPLVRNAVREDDIKSRETVRRDNEEIFPQVIHVADFPLFRRQEPGECGTRNDCRLHCTSNKIPAGKTRKIPRQQPAGLTNKAAPAVTCRRRLRECLQSIRGRGLSAEGLPSRPVLSLRTSGLSIPIRSWI